MVKQRTTYLKARRHARPVDLDQAIVGQVAGEIQIHHRLEGVANVRPALPIREQMQYGAGTADQLRGLLESKPLTDEHIERVGGAKAGGAFGSLTQPLGSGEAIAEKGDHRLGGLAGAGWPSLMAPAGQA